MKHRPGDSVLFNTRHVIRYFSITSFRYVLFLFLFFSILSTNASCDSYSNRVKTEYPKDSSFAQSYFPDSLPKAQGYLNDFEYLFTEEERLFLDSLLEDFDERTSIQIAVITIDTAMTSGDSLEAYTLKIANTWGVGEKGKDNGVLIGISRAYRKMRIQNGYGIEKILTNTETKEIIDTAFIPGFRNANYFQGTLNGLKSLMKVLEARYKT